MKHELGKCLKCGTQIISNKRPLSNFKQQVYLLKSGDKMLIGLCDKCEILPSEYKQAIIELNKLEDLPINTEIESHDGEDTAVVINCHKCGKPITGSYATNAGFKIHEQCVKMPILEHTYDKGNAGKIAKEKSIKRVKKDV